MIYLQKDEIIWINQRTIERHGGNFVPPVNILNESTLDYVLEIVAAEMFGEPLYPHIWDKAAVYFHTIITGHIFQDGNKRTGLAAALAYLKLNGYRLKEQLEKVEFREKETSTLQIIPSEGEDSKEVLIILALETAAGRISLDACKQWFEKNIVSL